MNGVTVQYCISNRVVGAVQRDDPELLVEVLKTGKYIGHDDLSKALHVAARKGFDECARILLEANAMPNIHDASGLTPIVIAARSGHANVIKALIQGKCNVDKATFRIRATAAHWAASHGYSDCLLLLLKAGANPEAKTIHMRTPLMMAARMGHVDILEELISWGADVSMVDFEGATALILSSEEGCTECIRRLLREGANIDAQKRNGDTAVIQAAKAGHKETVQLLIRKSCDLEKRGHHMTALHWAAEAGQLDCVQVLLKAGIDPRVTVKDSYCGGDFIVNGGVTPLMMAAREGHTDVVRFLATSDPKLDHADDDGYTALLYSATRNHHKCVQELILAGADPDGVIITENRHFFPEITNIGIYTSGDISPLVEAVKKNYAEVVKVLIRANCSMNILGFDKGGDPVTPFEYALSKGYINITKMLLLVGFNPCIANTPMIEESLAWIANEDEETFESLIEELRTPPSLLRVSRMHIRRVMNRRVMDRIDSLPLPPPLKRFIALCDLDEF